jgi:hypothetical protein
MKETAISDIERINVIIFILGSILSLVIMRDFQHFFSFAVASAIMTLNFRLLRKIIEGGLRPGSVRKINLFLMLPVSFLILGGLVAIVFIYGDIKIISFLLGLSTVFISIIINQFVCMFTPAAKRRQKNGA